MVNKHETNEKSLELFVSTLVVISQRFKINTQSLNSFLMRYAGFKSKSTCIEKKYKRDK